MGRLASLLAMVDTRERRCTGARGAIVFCFLLLVSACVSTNEYVLLQNEMNELKSRDNSQSREIASLKRAVKKFRETSTHAPPGGVIEALRDSQEMILGQLTEINNDLKLMQGRIDEDKYGADRAFRDSETERALLRAQLEETRTELKNLADGLASLEAKLSELEQSVAPAQATEQPVPNQTLGPPMESYQALLKLFRDGQTAEARKGFEVFLQRYPDTDLSDNAQFWIAEAFFKEGNYEDAILSYEELIKRFPKSDKVPGAMLKQANAFQELGDSNTTKVILSTLKERFPQSREARIARKKLLELKKSP